MPTEIISTYLSCKKTPSSFFGKRTDPGVEWHEATSSEISTAREFSGELINRVYHLVYTFTDRHLLLSTLANVNLYYPFKNISEVYSNSPYKESLKLSLDIFKEFDEHDNPLLFPLYDRLIFMMADQIVSLISNKKCTVAFDFSEIFLLSDDETPPPHFRPGIDKRVNNLMDYKKNVSKFSYNLAKALFTVLAPRNNILNNSPDNIVAQHYSNTNALLSNKTPNLDFMGPLNEIQYFNCVFEAYVFLHRHKRALGNHAILAFGPAVEILELEAIINDESFNQTKEIIIILRGNQYDDAKIRQNVYEQTLALIKKTKCHAILQVILLSNDKTGQSLIDLAPDQHQKIGAFSPLTDEAGYYLSSPDIFSACYRNIQALDENKSWFKQLDIKSQPNAHPVTSLGKTSAYIYSKEATADFRKAKLFSKQRLKSNVTLSLTHQIAQEQALQQTQALQQEQELSQSETQAQCLQQDLTEDRQQTQKQDIQRSSFGIPQIDFSCFCHRLETEAIILLAKEMPQEHLLDQCGYYTNYYHQHHRRLTFLRQLAENQAVRESLAAKIFGLAYSNNHGKHSLIHLPNYSFGGIGSQLYACMLANELMDGLNPSEREFTQSYFSSDRTLTNYKYLAIGDYCTVYQHSNLCRNMTQPFPLYVSSLALNCNAAPLTYQSHLNAYVLLSEEELASLPIDQQTLLSEHAKALLSLFKGVTIYNREQILVLENQYTELIKFYFPDSPDYLRILEKFMSVFEEHNDDNLRIMLQIIISGHRSKLEDFLKLLTFLESRCLLENFYKIYFKYALNISSVEDLLKNAPPPLTFDIFLNSNHQPWWSGIQTAGSLYFDSDESEPRALCMRIPLPNNRGALGSGSTTTKTYEPNQTIFTQLATLTPEVASAEEWPAFEKLFHHMLVFTARYNILFAPRHADDLKRLWRRLFAKFLVYTNHQEQEAQRLLDSLVNHLVATEGLTIAPLSTANTLLVVLEKLLDNAIAKHTLKEQIEEIGGLSFLWLDTPYALAYNGFQIACSEMELHSSAINPTTKRYSVSLTELKNTLENYTLEDDGLKTTVFRYLGTETLRDDIVFYRELFNKTVHHPGLDNTKENINKKRYLEELVIGYFVATSTGIHYNAHLDQDLFSKDFYTFLAKKSFREEIPTELVSSCLQDFFNQLKQTPSHIQKGTTTLWSLCLSTNSQNLADSKGAIPEILTQKFDKKQLLRFILSNSDALKACTPLLKKIQPLADLLIRATIEVQFSELNLDEYKNVPFLLLSQLYPKLNMDGYIKEIAKIEALINYQALFIQRGAKASIYTAFKKIFEQENSIDVGLILSELLANEMAQDESNSKIGLAVELLTQLSPKPRLLTNISTIKPLLTLVTELYLNAQTKTDELPRLLNLCETLINLDVESATHTLTILLKQLRTPECHPFFTANSGLTAEQLHGISQLFEKVDDPSAVLPFIQLNLQENPQNNFITINKLLKSATQEHAKQLLLISNFICSLPHQNSLEQLTKLTTLSPSTLDQLVQLRELHSIERQTFIAILESPTISNAIAQYSRNKYATNLKRYDYDSNEIAEKISQIKRKSFTDDEDSSLNDKTQKKLLNDYNCLMSYMTTNPVLIEQDETGIKQNFTVNQLNEAQFHTLFKQLQTRITNNDNKHQYELMLLALSCEALYRTTHKFPRNTQILSLINSLNQEGNLIHELKTGEGKSIIAALHGVLLNAENRTVDIATENDQLARDGLNKFKRFYNYLGVPCGSTIIEAHSPHNAYIENGVNYSTAPGFSLFRTQMQLDKNPLQGNASLICDEIDATLTTTVQYRLAATINPLLQDKKSWPLIYKHLLDFVKKKDLFLSNKCSKEDDVQNFKNYLLLNSTKKNLSKFICRLPNELLGTLIESAMIANQLEEDIDYIVVTKTTDKTYYYAAPILESTKRPDAKVSYSTGVHQLLHTRLNNNSTTLKYPFEIEPSTDTLVVVSAKNFFDYYRLNGARTVGFTGTAGTRIELKEFFQENALTAFSYPTFRKDQCQNLGLLTTIGPEAHLQAILDTLREHKKTTPDQPILIITGSPKATLLLTKFLATNHPDWSIQSYSGYEQAGCSEGYIIQIAGKNYTTTIATQSLARGTDIDPNHAQGLFVINTCTDLTESDLRQIQGRAARNGKPGQFYSIIDAEKLGAQTSTLQEMTASFKAHQQQLTLTKQKDRLKTRLLEEVRDHIISHYFLKVRARADNILSKQYGRNSSLVPTQDFLQTICTFNQNTERQYTELLDNNPRLEGPAIEVFFEGRVKEYQQALERWLPDELFQQFKAVEPLIPLENLKPLTALNSITMDQLTVISQFLSTGWKELGHQQMQENFARLDTLQETFKPYFNKQQSFKYMLAETLQNQNILDPTEALSHIEALEKRLLEFPDLCAGLPVVGYFIPVEKIKSFITDYFKVTKQQIQEKKWDDLALPSVDTSTISLWWNRISTVMMVGSIAAAGPIPFIVKKILIPAIGTLVTSLFKTKFATSRSTSVQLLLSLNEMSSDFSKALTALLSISKSEEMTLGIFLDNIAPLLKNKAFLSFMTSLLELNDMAYLIPYLKATPELLDLLDPYRDRKLNEALNVETILHVLQQASQFEFIKTALEHTEYKTSVMRLIELKPKFISAFRHLSFPEFLGFLKVIAHPNFFEFLKTLPAQTTFAELTILLDAKLDNVPPEVKPALSELRSYQSNREKIEEDSRQSLLTLKGKFMLSSDTLKNELARLTPKPPIILSSTSDTTLSALNKVPQTPWLKYAAILIGFSLIISVNILFFSVNLLLTSIIVTSLFSYPFVKKYVSDFFATKHRTDHTEEPLSEKPAEPILVTIASHKVRAAEIINTKQIDSVTSPINDEIFDRAAYKVYGLFRRRQENADGDAESLSEKTRDLMSMSTHI